MHRTRIRKVLNVYYVCFWFPLFVVCGFWISSPAKYVERRLNCKNVYNASYLKEKMIILGNSLMKYKNCSSNDWWISVYWEQYVHMLTGAGLGNNWVWDWNSFTPVATDCTGPRLSWSWHCLCTGTGQVPYLHGNYGGHRKIFWSHSPTFSLGLKAK